MKELAAAPANALQHERGSLTLATRWPPASPSKPTTEDPAKSRERRHPAQPARSNVVRTSVKYRRNHGQIRRNPHAGNALLEAAAEPILRARAGLRRELAGLEKLVRHLAIDDPVCRLLMTMPGVGPVIALTFKAAIDDPGRFRRSKDVGPWVGLTPGRDQSGERNIVGAITKAGDAGLRTALYQAATVMLNRARPNWLKAWALRLAVLRGKKRATVALARRLGVVLHRMWRDGTAFCFTREAAMACRAA